MDDDRFIDDTSEAGLAQQTQAHRQERSKRLFWAVATSIMTRPLAVLIPFLTVPLFIGYLGKEGFGLYESIGALSAWMALSNAGLGLGLMNRLSDCYVSSDQLAARRYVSTMFVGILTITIILTLLLLVFVPIIPWSMVFPTTSEALADQVPWAVAATGLCVIIGLPLGLLQPIYSAYQEIQILNLWDALRRLILLAACFLVVYTNWGLAGGILATAGAGIPISIINTWFLFRRKPWLRPSPRLYDGKIMRSMLTDGMGFLLLQLSVVLLYQTDRIIIGMLVGPEAVTPYAVAARLFMIFHGVYMLVLGPLWPAIGEALRRGDKQWAKRALRLLTALGCTLILAIGCLLYFQGDWVFALWTRDQTIHVPPILILGLTLTFLVRVWIDAHSIVLNASQIIWPQVYFLLTQGALSMGIAVCAALTLGSSGVAWASGLAGLLTCAWGYVWLLRKHVFTN